MKFNSKNMKTISKKKYKFHVRGRILKWTLPPECIADRWEIIPSISLTHNSTMLAIKFAWICFELTFMVITLRVWKIISVGGETYDNRRNGECGKNQEADDKNGINVGKR